jgi:hypothetical protein
VLEVGARSPELVGDAARRRGDVLEDGWAVVAVAALVGFLAWAVEDLRSAAEGEPREFTFGDDAAAALARDGIECFSWSARPEGVEPPTKCLEVTGG